MNNPLTYLIGIALIRNFKKSFMLLSYDPDILNLLNNPEIISLMEDDVTLIETEEGLRGIGAKRIKTEF